MDEDIRLIIKSNRSAEVMNVVPSSDQHLSKKEMDMKVSDVRVEYISSVKQ